MRLSLVLMVIAAAVHMYHLHAFKNAVTKVAALKKEKKEKAEVHTLNYSYVDPSQQ